MFARIFLSTPINYMFKMKKSVSKTVFLTMLLCSAITHAQVDTIMIPEGDERNLCGRIVIVDELWMNEGFLKADISILEKQNSKPITGGYKTGDEITISSEAGCTYYIYSIFKTGSLSNKGTVTLSKNAPERKMDVRKDEIILEENYTYKSGDFSWYVASIRKNEGKVIANITITKNTALIEELVLTKGEMVWIENELYKIESIEARSEFIKTDPEKIYEPLPGKIVFKSVYNHFNEK